MVFILFLLKQAKEIIGSTLLIRSDDIPELQEGEFYTPHLVGMRVILKVFFLSIFAITILY
jgi:hypothetical protein